MDATSEGDGSGCRGQDPAPEAPLGVSRPKRTLGESGVLRARTPLEFLSDTNGSIHDLTLSEVGSGPVGKNTQCPCGLLRLSS